MGIWLVVCQTNYFADQTQRIGTGKLVCAANQILWLKSFRISGMDARREVSTFSPKIRHRIQLTFSVNHSE